MYFGVFPLKFTCVCTMYSILITSTRVLQSSERILSLPEFMPTVFKVYVEVYHQEKAVAMLLSATQYVHVRRLSATLALEKSVHTVLMSVPYNTVRLENGDPRLDAKSWYSPSQLYSTEVLKRLSVEQRVECYCRHKHDIKHA